MKSLKHRRPPYDPHRAYRLGPRSAFSILELLVTIAILGVLASILLPTLSRTREAGRQAVCLSNVRQATLACRMYADDNDGYGPAIGVPWERLPFWALVVQEWAGAAIDPDNISDDGDALDVELYATDSTLVCPTVDASYPERMTRTYAMNATGHAGLTPPNGPPDADNFDREFAHINFSLIARPSALPLLTDSAVAFIPDDAPPPTRTSSVIDFRQDSHVTKRLGYFHAGRRRFDAGMFDGSARPWGEVHLHWKDPLP
jgi:prepilin-type N-terminal cleavage/methylation domain-containing protein